MKTITALQKVSRSNCCIGPRCLIVRPCAVFLGRKQQPPRPPPLRPPPIRDTLNKSMVDRMNETIGGQIQDNMFGGNETNKARLPPPASMAGEENLFSIVWKGESYECISRGVPGLP